MTWSRLALAVILAASVAAAQVTTYELQNGAGWVETDAPEPGTDAAVMAEARRLLASDQPSAARTILNQWIEQNKRTASPYLPQAYLLRGDAILAMGNEYKALYDYETVIKDFPASPEFVQAVERELDIGTRYLRGLRRKVFGLRIESAASVGEELLVRVGRNLELTAFATDIAGPVHDTVRQTMRPAQATSWWHWP